MRYLSLIVKNSLRSRRRSLLTVASLALSLCVLATMMSMYYSFYWSGAPPAQALRFVTRHKVSLLFQMPPYYAGKIRQVAGVKAVTATQWYGGRYKEEQRDRRYFFPRIGAEPDRLLDVFAEWQVEPREKEAFLRDRAGCIVGAELARRMGFRLGDRIVVRGDYLPFDLAVTVRAIYHSTVDSGSLYFHLKYIEEALAAKGDRRSFAGSFQGLAGSKAEVPRIMRAIDALFANSEAPTRTETEQAFTLSFLSFLGNVKLALASICAAVTFTILLIAANTMAMSVRERVREVGVLKTLGFRPGTILGLILGESTLIALFGCLCGLLLAEGLCALVRGAPGAPPQVRSLSVRPEVAAAVAGVALLIGGLSSFVPAWSAACKPILDALRTED